MGPSAKRFVVLAAAVGMQMCLGATYAWAVFVASLRSCTGLGQGLVQLPFTVFYTAFPATAAVAGLLMGRLGGRRSAMVGGVLFGSGWLLAGAAEHHFVLTVLGIGVLGGVGVGLAYLVPIATCVQWFPEHKGLVTGIAVAGFGGGAALVSQAGNVLMEAHGGSPFAAFRVLGAVFLCIVPLTATQMVLPGGRSADGRARSGSGSSASSSWSALRSALADRRFWLLYAAMFTGLVAGFAVNANLRELAPGAGARAGVAAVGLFALGNAAGRVLWGLLFDRVSTRTAVVANLMAQAVVLLGAPWLLGSAVAPLYGCALAAGLNYGGVLVIYAAGTARIFGSTRVAAIYGWLFSANIPAAAAPIVAGVIFDRTGTFTPALWAIAVLLAVAAVAVVPARLEP